MEQEFEDYLRKKKIDPKAFQTNEPKTYSLFKEQFLHIHPNSFTMQKLFLINVLRRKYHFQNEVAPPAGSVKAKAKPVVRKASSAGKTEGNKASKPRIKPKTSKPVLPSGDKAGGKQKSSEGTAKKAKVKPKIRPKVKAEKEDTGETGKPKVAKSKPVIKKPVMKPKIKPEEKSKKEDPEQIKSKPKKNKPVIKPRIPKKDK